MSDEEDVWTCEGCGKEFATKEEAEKHEKNCPLSKLSGPELRNLLESINKNLDKLVFIVGICGLLYAIRTFV